MTENTQANNDIRILVVEDDASTQLLLQNYLKKSENYKIVLCSLGLLAIEFFKDFDFDIVLLDIKLPDISGLDLIQNFRQKNNASIIMLSSSSSSEDKVLSMQRGADAYIEKPVDLPFLKATIDRLFERQQSCLAPLATNQPVKAMVSSKPQWSLSASTWSLELDGQAVIRLTPTEYKVIELLARHQGVAISCEKIAKNLDRDDYENYQNAIRTIISRLRKKVKDKSPQPLVIKAFRSEGYLLVSQIAII